MSRPAFNRKSSRRSAMERAALALVCVIVLSVCATALTSQVDLGTVVSSARTDTGEMVHLSYDSLGVRFSTLSPDGRLLETRRLWNGSGGSAVRPGSIAVTDSGTVYYSVFRVHLESNLIIGETVFRAPEEEVYWLEHTLDEQVLRSRLFELRNYGDEVRFLQRDGNSDRVLEMVVGESGGAERRRALRVPQDALAIFTAGTDTAVYSMPDSTIWCSGEEDTLLYAAETRPGGEHVLERLWQEENGEMFFTLVSGERFRIDLEAWQIEPYLKMNAESLLDMSCVLSVKLLIQGFLIFAALFTLVLLTVWLFVSVARRLRGHLTVARKQALALVPVIGVGFVAGYFFFHSYLTETYKAQSYESLYSLGAAKAAELSGFDLSSVDWDAPLQDPEYNRLAQMLNPDYQEPSEKRSVGDTPVFTHQPFVYQFLHVVREGELYTAVTDSYIGYPIARVQTIGGLAERMPDMLLQSLCLYGELRAQDGAWQTVLLPVYDGGKGVAAVLEIGVSSSAVQARVEAGARRVTLMLALFAIGLELVAVFVIARSYRRLRALAGAVSLLGKGQYGSQADIQGHDEIARIAAVFNEMSLKTREVMDTLQTINKAYFRFVPEKLLALVGCKDVVKAAAGDQSVKSLTLLFVRVDGGRPLEQGETIQSYNRLFEAFVPFVEAHGGVIERYQGRGFIALFDGGAYEAGAAAMKIAGVCEDRELVPSIAVHRAEVTLGIMGVEGRLEARAVSEQVELTGRLARLAAKLDCRLIVTARAHEEIRKRGGGGTRRLGRVHRGGVEETIEIFEVYQADVYLKREGKARGLEVFHKALAMVEQKRWREARRLFIEALRDFGDDGAARTYLELCEYRVSEPDAPGDGWLEL